MSYQHALELFEFKSMEDLTTESLKRAFKKQVLVSHPDKGGHEGDFDMLLSAYLYLSETLHRLSGGRATLLDVNAPDRIKEARANQLINEVFEDFERDRLEELFRKQMDNESEMDGTDGTDAKYSRLKLDASFHEQFEKVREQTKGYSEWLQSKDTNLITTDGQYGELTIKATIAPSDIKDLNSAFESSIGVTPSVSTLALHPDQMAYCTGNMGHTLVEQSSGFTSAPGLNPEYTDVYQAFTSENTVFDKVQPGRAVIDYKDALAKMIAEREKVYECVKDEELEAIAEYEQKKIEADKKHKNSIQQYFNGSVKSLQNGEEKEVGFCIMIGK
jgi:hypothetical protein